MGIDYEILGKNIQRYRKSKGITQEKMAEQLDLSVSFISQVERGVAKTSLDTLCDICDFLECAVSDLLTFSQKSTPLIMDFIDIYKKLPYKEQKLFYFMLKTYQEHIDC